MVIPVQIDSLQELYKLQQLACKANEPVYVHSTDGSIMVDARSSLGLLTLDLTQPVNVVTDSTYVMRKLGVRSGIRA
ncbi:hypothetical protein AAAT94_05485 [Intestinimonas aquisgranensis]|nr:hypothetical protein [Intestinimonas aquisgranensis]